eukprot:CAMPEP_0197001200 /NCGR_PEP_ID=MMETSP1380-20130617/5948_1 /TAXON_ID=5936 /ORGANISM="Euplotes crassus, Strain CT5" /LENGTH=58 /DNA_ID=CAMNT_0042418769 /DNA_START=473 /DNA_END=649 /DNA_ORIENTATION=-
MTIKRLGPSASDTILEMTCIIISVPADFEINSESLIFWRKFLQLKSPAMLKNANYIRV